MAFKMFDKMPKRKEEAIEFKFVVEQIDNCNIQKGGKNRVLRLLKSGSFEMVFHCNEPINLLHVDGKEYEV